MTAVRGRVDGLHVSTPVDGTVHRQSGHHERRGRSSACVVIVVEPEVLMVAKAVCREGEHIVLISATRVDIVRDDGDSRPARLSWTVVGSDG